MRDAGSDGALHRLGHALFVNLVGAGIRNAYDGRRQPGGGKLRLEQFLAHAVNAHASEGLGHRRQRADDIVVAGKPRRVQRPGRILAARPGDQSLRTQIFRTTYAITDRHPGTSPTPQHGIRKLSIRMWE